MYDAVIVGAGIVGSATGYYLAKKGLKVAIVEKAHPTSGASGACNGGLSYFGKNGKLLQAAFESLLIYRNLSQELEYPIQLCQDEIFVQLAVTEKETVQLERNVKECVSHGLEAKMITKKQLHDLIPGLSHIPIGAAIAQGGLHGFVNPFNVTYGLLTKLKVLGGQLLQNWEVTNILTSGGKVEGVANNDRVILAPIVILCTGFETSGLLKDLNIHIDIIPARGVVLVTEKVPWRLKKKIMGTNFGKSYRKAVSLCIEQSLDGNLLIGSSHEPGVVERIVSSQLISSIACNALSFYPTLEKINVIRVFSGIRPQREEGPLLGEIKGYKGLYVASGHGGMGVTLAPWTGHTMAEMIVS